MIERQIVVDAFDGQKIYAIWNKVQETCSDKVVILAHGLTGHANEYIHQMARIYFNERGYDVVRISFYSANEGARNLIDTTLDIHGRDLNALLDYVQPLYKKVFVAGHSYGGLTLLFAQPKVSALAFWDPSFVPWEEFWQNDIKEMTSGQIKAIGWGVYNIVGEAMLDEAKLLTIEASSLKAASISSPSLVVLAENETDLKRQELFDALTCKKEIVEVRGASHCFNEALTVKDLLAHTYDWFEKH